MPERRLAVRLTPDALHQVRGGHLWVFDRVIVSNSIPGASAGSLAVLADLDVSDVRYSRYMDKIWSADELRAMSPAERQVLFDANSSTDLADVPEKLLELARRDIESHVARTQAPTSIYH